MYNYKRLSDCIRILTADAIQQASSGHPGMPLGFADVFTVLAFEFLKFSPEYPKHPERDRLVLSAGHGSMLLYAFYYLAGYKDFTLDDIKNFRALHSKTPGHPEYGIYDAVETTTGPLGQGIATSVGIALAAKKKQANYKIYTIVGDGCLMEGLSYESASIAGHLNLNNLIVLFDDNQITIDGATALAVSENHLQKFEALGWQIERVDGHNFNDIKDALSRAQDASKPYIIACRTVIGCGIPNKAGSEQVHGAPLGKEVVSALKKALDFKDEPFFIPEDLLKTWRGIVPLRSSTIPIINVIHTSCDFYYDDYFKEGMNSEATRISSGKILASLMKHNPYIIAGSADLSFSNNLKYESSQVISKENYNGNFIHYGARENAMSSIMNGLALEGYVPVGGTFLVFSDYMRPGIRLAAIMNLKVIYIMTHDSVGVGEDGPSHQPIEHLASLRAIPNLIILRPADYIETLEAWAIALQNDGPVMLVLTRQTVPSIRHHYHNESLDNKELAEDASACNQCQFGAYIIDDAINHDITIFASGSELSLAIQVKALMTDRQVRIVSVPSFELFFKQPKEYIDYLLAGNNLKVGIEAASSFGWHKIIGRDGLFFGIDQFGSSAPATELYKIYNLEASMIAENIRRYAPPLSSVLPTSSSRERHYS